jgi:long-chain acyl-CoA synthetase
MNPATLLSTIKKHKVTHIFAVPLVWDKIRKQAVRSIKSKGDKTYLKFKRVLKLPVSFGPVGSIVAAKAAGEVREALFGDSVKFLISGGSHIKPKTLEFFNGIGYHLANGYGMTEIGITSVETAERTKQLNKGSIGAPFSMVEYKISDTGELMVRTKAMASRIIQGSSIRAVDFDEWFNTRDLARVEDGKYYVQGRVDDLIVCKSGENINPVLAEAKIKVDGCDAVCIFSDENKSPVLIASAPECFSGERVSELVAALTEAIGNAGLANEIKTLALTTDSLIEGSEFKISRKRVAARYARGEYRIINRDDSKDHITRILSDLESEVRACFATALEKQVEDISPDASFFLDLGGSSLDYFMLLNLLKSKYGIALPSTDEEKLYTVRDFCDFITKGRKE